jgi:hypothetical protein
VHVMQFGAVGDASSAISAATTEDAPQTAAMTAINRELIDVMNSSLFPHIYQNVSLLIFSLCHVF